VTTKKLSRSSYDMSDCTGFPATLDLKGGNYDLDDEENCCGDTIVFQKSAEDFLQGHIGDGAPSVVRFEQP
jgi:hypothetical protein